MLRLPRVGLIVLAAALGLAAAGSRAEDESAPSGRGQGVGEAVFQWVPPPSTDEKARYSIGVFDAGGKLVRRLAEAAPESSFSAGMNGFVTRWDLKGDGGKRVPNGRYTLRGVAIPPLKVSGVAAATGGGNDWVKDDPALQVARVLDLAFTEDGGAVFLLRLSSGSEEVARYAADLPESGDWKLRWHVAVPGRAAKEGAEPRGAEAVPAPAAERVLAITTEAVAVGDGNERWVWRLHDGSLASAETTGVEAALVDAQTERKAAGWRLREVTLRKDRNARLWWKRDAVGEGETVTLVEPVGDRAEVRMLWSRTIGRSADKTEPPTTPTVRLELARGGLDSKKRVASAAITLRAVADEKGAHLATAEGLRLRTVSATKGLRTAVLAMGEGRGKVRFFARGDTGTEEFLVEGCDRLALFQLGACTVGDTGEVTKPGEDEKAER